MFIVDENFIQTDRSKSTNNAWTYEKRLSSSFVRGVGVLAMCVHQTDYCTNKKVTIAQLLDYLEKTKMNLIFK